MKLLKQSHEFVLQQIVKPQIVFTVLASIAGLVLVFLVPPMQVPDEQTHFFQSYAVSDFNFIPSKFQIGNTVHYGSELPKSVYNAATEFREGVAGNASVKFETELLDKYINKKLEPQIKENVDGTVYPPFVYIPQSVGISIGKLFEVSPLTMIWMGRLANLLVWILLVFVSIKIIPFGKWILAVLALNPMAVFLSASMSADVLTIGLSFLLFALVASTLKKSYVITKTKVAAIVATVAVLVLTKPVSILLILLLLLIPRKAFANKRRHLLFFAGTVVAALSIFLFWNFVSFDAANAISQFQRPGMGVDSAAQLAQVFNNPFIYLKSLLLNYVFVLPGYPGDAVLRSSIGVFGWLDTYVPLWVVMAYLAVLLLVVIYEAGRGVYLSVYQKLVLITIAVLYSAGTVTALYLFYTPVGQTMIGGVQGRYFIPISVLLAGIFTARLKILNIKKQTLAIIVISSMIVVLGMVMLRIALRYYY